MRFIGKAAASVGAAAVLFGGSAGVAFGARSGLTAQVYVNGNNGAGSAKPGDTVKIGETLNGTQGDSNGGSFTTTFDRHILSYAGEQYPGGVPKSGDGCTLTDGNHLSCDMDLHNSSKSITLVFKVNKDTDATTTVVKFVGENGYGHKAKASGTVNIIQPTPPTTGTTTPPPAGGSTTAPPTTPGTPTTPPASSTTTPPAAGGTGSGGTGNGGSGGASQVSVVPVGSVDTGSGSTAGVEDPWLFGVGGAAVLAGLAGLGFARKPRKQ